MGIPSYFRIIVKNYNNILQNTNKYPRVNRLFLDLNCAIHPCCREIVENAKKENIAPKESDMIGNVLLKIVELVTITRPKLLYIAVDGVAPLAKINQQRQRRYKSAKEQQIWNTSAISPGTEFMKKLNISLNRFNHHGIKIIINDSDTSGEGEHKILDYINTTDIPKDSSIFPDVIYGLDADLIMLGLIAKNRNILLLREKTEYHIEEEQIETTGDYLYLNIPNIKKGIISEMNKEYTQDSQKYIDDYVFMCFMLGNDFLKPIPSLQIRYNGLELLLDSYYKCSSNDKYFRLIDDGEIIKENLKLLLNNITEKEDSIIQNIVEIRNKQRKGIYHRVKGDPEKIQENTPLLNNPDEMSIRLGEENWRQRYQLNGLFNTINYTLNTLKKDSFEHYKYTMCQQYYTGLQWCARYYFQGYKSVNNLWYYPYNISPDLQTFLDYDYNNKEIIKEIEYKKPLEKHEALLAMMPKSSIDLLPKKFQKFMKNDSPLAYYYPDNFKEYMVLKRYSWECVPLLPKINVTLLRKIIN